MTNGQGLLQHVFNGLTAFAQQHLAEHRQRQERLTALHDAIEQAVDASEPRIRLVGNYAEKLVDAVEKPAPAPAAGNQGVGPPMDDRRWTIDDAARSMVYGPWSIVVTAVAAPASGSSAASRAN